MKKLMGKVLFALLVGMFVANAAIGPVNIVSANEQHNSHSEQQQEQVPSNGDKSQEHKSH
ncbi:hypothetical protein [Sporomusa acidovorans]|uniref:hypothetical protein n=1 Tax=Sporomusa acidovorans TaxID=112900 RepID=UPI00088E6EAF|nr:hypothetical protein [Sporomusa acidovorans]OZC19091.1 hypothetical protein SPACI_31770 [Sporomusa acidovorans DSM 3132]SDD66901.1 hypothetical protein SAMN04488499_100337 [Sporomusa acidovorans]